MSDHARKKKVIEVEMISPYDFDGLTIDQLIERLQSKKNEYGGQCYLDWRPDFQYPYDPSPTPKYFLLAQRLETDEEMADRISREESFKKAAEERELAELERLQKKYRKVG